MTKVNGNSDGLDIPAALRRTKGETKPTAKPSPAKPAATKAAPKSKPLTAKQAAQKRAGVKVTADKAVKAPAPAAAAPAKTPEAKLIEGKAQIKAAKAAKPVGELLAAVKKHAKHFAHKNGWDLLLLQSDAELKAQLEGIPSKSAAIVKMRKVAQGLNKSRPKDQPAPARA
jgi:hypothetical protein